MATVDRFGSAEHQAERRAGGARLAVFAESMVWFAIAIAGTALVFIGLGVDAWRHEDGAQAEELISLGNPGHVIAGIGLVITAVAALVGFSLSALRGVDSVQQAIRRMVPVTATWAVLAAVGVSSITYIGATGVTVGDDAEHAASSAAASDPGNAAPSDKANLAGALKNEGIDPSGGDPGDNDPAQVAGALTGGQGADGTMAHDMGKQPTFEQWSTLSDEELLPLFPAGTVTAEDLPALRDQIMRTREFALKYPTTEAAEAAGYRNTTSDVPFMGMHYLNFDMVRKGTFDPDMPTGLLFSKVDDGPPKLVGVWFLLLPGVNGNTREQEPAGFAGNLDMWHAHVGLCLVGTSSASENETRESCEAKGGSFTADLRWMMHVWVAPGFDNPDGTFIYLNSDLYAQQVAAQGGDAPSGTTAE